MTVPRLAMVGCGQWSTRMHLPALKCLAAQGMLKCAGVCDLDAARAETYAAELGGVPVFSDFEQMIAEAAPDAVGMAVPCELSAAFIERAAAAGIPFLIEKPPAPSAEVHRRLIAAVGNLGHVVAYNRRHAPYIRQAAEWMAGQTVQSVTVMFSRHRRTEEDFTSTAVHGIDAGLYLAGGKPRELNLAVVPAGGAHSFFINGWTDRGVRIDMMFTPDTASAVEHYIVRGTDRTVFVSFPQPPMIDVPGCVELHENNKVIIRKGPADFGLTDDDLSGLGGLPSEYESLLGVLEGRPGVSTLANTLTTQIVREELGRMLNAQQTARVLKFD